MIAAGLGFESGEFTAKKVERRGVSKTPGRQREEEMEPQRRGGAEGGWRPSQRGMKARIRRKLRSAMSEAVAPPVAALSQRRSHPVRGKAAVG
jgi:hypothetical protein